MVERLNKKEREILYLLSKNGREKLNEIAKELNTSKQLISYHLKLLEEKEIINKFSAIINWPVLGMNKVVLKIKFVMVEEKKEKEFIDFLLTKPFVKSLLKVNSRWDFIVDVFVKDMKSIYDFMIEIEEKFGRYILSTDFVSVSKEESLPYKFIIEKTGIGNIKTIEFYSKQINLDLFDKKLLNILIKDARKSAVEIAKELNVDARKVINIRKNLEERGVIIGYNLDMNFKKAGYFHYKILVDPLYYERNLFEKFTYFLKTKKETIKILYNISRYILEVDVVVKDIKEVEEIIKEIKEQFSGFIREIIILNIEEKIENENFIIT